MGESVQTQIPNEYLQKLIETEQRSKSNTHAINDIKEDQTLLRKMVENIGVIAEQTKTTSEKLNKISEDVDALKHSEISRSTKEQEIENREKDFKDTLMIEVKKLSEQVEKLEKEEEKRKAKENEEIERRNSFKDTFIGRITYTILEKVVIAVLLFILISVTYYFKLKYLS